MREEETCQRLMIVPGAGQITALAFRAIIDPPDRLERRVTPAPISA